MDRQTRKANLKKLQLRATTNDNKRNTRSSNNTAMSISDYLNPPATTAVTTKTHNNLPETIIQEPVGLQVDNKLASSPPTTSLKPVEKKLPLKPKRTKLTDFVLHDDDFAPSSQIKKAPTIKKTRKQTTTTKSSRARNKKQPNIKSAFFRNEQMFSEITAQHCMADNFSPEDVEMALAISKSEIEVQIGGNAPIDRDVVVDLLDQKGKPVEDVNETIRTKLKKYGFRTGNLQDYANYTACLLPAANHRRPKSKWANKFTSLTLRNPEVQHKKANRKIEEFLAQQFKITHLNNADYYIKPYEPLTGILKLCTAPCNDMILNQRGKYKMPTKENLDIYFVNKLFEVTTVNAGHLLKDWDLIQGRDLSPQRKSKQMRLMDEKLKNIYKDLDIFFNKKNNPINTDDQKVVAVISESEVELDKMVELIEAMGNNSSNDIITPQRLKLSETNNTNDNLLSITQIKNDMNVIEQMSLVNIYGPSSPDIFADSDTEMHTDVVTTETEGTNNTADELKSITTYEIYSSEEEKTALHSGETVTDVDKSNTDPPIIDLTQSDGKENVNKEITMDMTVAKNTDTLYHNLLEGTINVSFLEELGEQKGENDNIDVVIAENDAVLKELTAKYLKTDALKSSKRTMQSLTQDNVTRSLKRSFTMTQARNTDLMLDDDFALAPKNDVLTLQRRSRSAIFPAPSSNTSSDSNFKLSSLSIDLTQEDDADDDLDNSNDDCMLSDDEINYSIWKANDTKTASLCADNQHDFSILDLFEDEDSPLKPTSSSGLSAISLECEKKEQNLVNNTDEFDFEKSQSLLTQAAIFKTPTKVTNFSDNDDNIPFTHSKESNAPMRRFRSTGSVRKFNDLLLNCQQGDITPPRFEDFDEFDKLIYGSAERNPTKRQQSATPKGMHALLTSEINFVPEQISPMKLENTPHTSAKLNTPTKPTKTDAGGEVVFDGRVYSVRICTSPVTDYSTYSDDKLLKILYDYGIKPLKRTQAVKLLQYIYDVTHPLIEAENDVRQTTSSTTTNATSEFDELYKKYGISQPKNTNHINQETTTRSQIPQCVPEALKFNLYDCSGDLLLRYNDVLQASVLPNEVYILPTNVTKKTSRPLLPFHIAWHNLVCSNETMHENLLTFLPIDLQEIYLFLKNLGYRYDPKEMKTFFDNRCIIFRYDLTPSNKTANNNRHIHKSKRKGTSKS